MGTWGWDAKPINQLATARGYRTLGGRHASSSRANVSCNPSRSGRGSYRRDAAPIGRSLIIRLQLIHLRCS